MGKKIAGLVLGGLALCFCWLNMGASSLVATVLGLLSLPMAIVGLVLACVGNKEAKNGLGTAGFVVSLIALILSALLVLTCGLCGICACIAYPGTASEYYEALAWAKATGGEISSLIK